MNDRASIDNFIESFLNQADPQNYNFEFEDKQFKEDFDRRPMNGGDPSNAIERYLVYKSTGEFLTPYYDAARFCIDSQEKYPNLPDSDGTLPEGYPGNINQSTREIYRTLWKWEDRSKQRYGKLALCLSDVGEFGPDTMHSVEIVLNEILKTVVERSSAKGYKKRKHGNYSLLYCLELYTYYRDALIRDLYEETSGLCDYIDAYHTIGNFVLVPAGFNQKRGGITPPYDFWDASLVWLKKYGYTSKKASFGHDQDRFAQYINYFFLWDYVRIEKSSNNENKEYKVKALYSSQFKKPDCADLLPEDKPTLKEFLGGVAKPTEEEIPIFLENARWAIDRRGIFMTAMLRLLTDKKVGALYNELRSELFATKDCYNGYDEVIRKINYWLEEREMEMPEEVHNTLKKLEDNA